MKKLFSLLVVSVLSLTPLSALCGIYGNVHFGASDVYVYETDGSVSVPVVNESASTANAVSIFAHNASTDSPITTAIKGVNYTNSAGWSFTGGHGYGLGSTGNMLNSTDYITIPVVNDGISQPETVIVLDFWSSLATVVAPSICTVHILDANGVVSLRVVDPYAYQLGPRKAAFEVTRVGDTSAALTVNFTKSGTATYSTDYTFSGAASATSVTIPAGATSATFYVVPVVDITPDPDETVTLTLAAGYYTTAGSLTGTTTIINKNPVVTLIGSDTNSVRSGDSGLLTFNRTADTSFPLSVLYNITGNASNGVDYTFISNSVTILAGETYATVTIDPIFNTAITTNRTATFTLAANSAYRVGSISNATVNIAPFDDNSRAVPTNGTGVLDATARTGRFIRGTANVPSYHSIVVPVDFEKGVALDNIGGNGTNLFPNNPWTNTLYHFNAMDFTSSTNIATRIAFQNPIVAFGERVGGSSMYFGQPYTFGIYAGDPKPSYTNSNTYTNALRIQVIDRTMFTNVATVYFPIPDVTQTAAWSSFLTNGYTTTLTAYGLTTTLYFDNPQTTWGALPLAGHSDIAYHLSHVAQSTGTNYIYLIELSGGTDMSWMVKSSSGARDWERLYTLEFTDRPAWRSLIIQLPAFSGEPIPPAYEGKSLEELLSLSPLVTNVVTTPTNATSYTNIDASPELRRHPALDQFVVDMGSDPIALANYVINEIEVTDPIDYNDNGDVDETSINLGGINRGAVQTFMEGQGSPAEQCALLVYLLRQANVPAVYLYPPHNGLKMLDARMSKIMRTQIRGAVSYDGTVYTTNHIIPVNYPWVAAYINTNWVHIFPWIKDTEIVEGQNVYNYMPTNYNNAFKWSRAYIYGDTNILSLDREDDTPNSLLPRFIKKSLNENAPTISMDELGMKILNRRHYYSRWQDFPTPTVLTNTQIVVESLGSSSITNVLPATTNLFNTINVTVSSVANPATKITTGDMRMAEVLNRRLLVRHSKISTNQTRLLVSMASFRTNIVTQKDFSTLSLTNTNVLCSLLSSNTLSASDDLLNVTIVHKRHRDMGTNILPGLAFLGLDSTLATTNIRQMSKGDLAAICLNAGRVTPKMLRTHADELWRMEQQVAATPSSTNSLSPDLYQGEVAYLMGMNYYQKVETLKVLLEQLHKTPHASFYASGLSRLIAKRDESGNLPSGNIVLVQPMVDMFFQEIALFGNGTLRPDSGDDGYGPLDQFDQLFITGGSALEHNVINTYFKQDDAISTVKLLHLAQKQSAGSIVRLDKNNYITEGNKVYPTGSTNKLKDMDAGMWKTITNKFTSASISNYVQVYMTPGKISNITGSYSGLGALLYTEGEYAALISANYNGGWGAVMDDNAVTVNNTPNYGLQMDKDGNYYFSFTSPTASDPVLTPDVLTSGLFSSTYSDIQTGASKLNEVQTDELNIARQLSGQAASTTQQDRLKTMENNGAQIPSVKHTTWEWIADPVNAVTGEFYVDSVDLDLKGPMPLQMRRNYSSQNVFDNGLGYGWQLNYMPFLSVSTDSNLVYCAEAEGSVIVYRRQTGANTNVWIPTIKDNPRLKNLSGSVANLFNATLLRTTNGGVTNFVLMKPGGEVRTYKVQSFPISTLTRQRPYLDTWTDNRGNSFQFSYGTNSALNDYGQVRRIQSSNGNFLGFYYDVYGHVIEAYTGDGRRVNYEYDQYGDLVNVTLPDGTKMGYEYQHLNYVNGALVDIYSSHLLIREDKPEGRLLQNDYDDERRVINQYSTVGMDLRLVRNASFVYSNNFVLTNSITNSINGSTTIKDYVGNLYVYRYTNGFVTNTIDPLLQTTEQYLYATNATAPGFPAALWKTKDKRGLWTEYQYDTSGNVTNTTVTGDLTGDGNPAQQAVIRATYNTNNLPLVVTDPIGNSITYIYDTNFLFLPQQIIKSVGGVPVSTNLTTYANITNVVVAGAVTNTYTAFGLRQTEIIAFNSADAVTNEWVQDGRGFITQTTRHTGSGDPDLVLNFFYNLRGEVVEQVDAANRTNRVDYDGMGRPISKQVIDETGTLVSWENFYYNANGEMTWSDGPRYNPEDYVWRGYDGAGNLSQEVHWRSRAKADGTGVEAETGDALYATTFREYDPFGNLVKVIDPRGNYTRMSYDAIGQLLESRQYDGSAGTNATPLAVTKFSYEAGGKIAFATNALGGVSHTLYTTTGKPFFTSYPNGSTNGWRYYLDGRLRREFQSNGAYWETTYDDAVRRTTKIFYTATGSALATNISEYDRRGNLVRTVDAAGFASTNVFDGLDRLKITRGPVISFDPPPGAPSSPGGTPPAVQQAVTNYYDAAGQVLITANALGEKKIVYSDALGRTTLTEIRDKNNALIRETSATYSADHHSSSVTQGSGTNAIVSTSYTDTDGHTVLSVGYPSANVQEFTLQRYDSAGNLVTSSRESSTNGTITVWSTVSNSYDGLNRLSTRLDRDNALTTFAYNSAGDLTNRAMPGGVQWRAIYNNASQLLLDFNLSAVGTLSRSNTYSYYASGPFVGLLQTSTDGRGVACTHTYDDYLRPTTNTYSGTAEQSMTSSLDYDVRGLVKSVRESFASTNTAPSTTVTRTYDPYGSLSTESVSIGSTTFSSAGMSYDSAGRRVGLGFGSYGYGYGWHADGALTTAIAPTGNCNYTYNTAGILTSRENGSLRYTGLDGHDGMGRPTFTWTIINGHIYFQEQLTWTGDGLVNTHQMDRYDFLAPTEQFTDDRTYTYAPSSRRLTRETLNLGPSGRWTNSFTFDNGASGGPGVLTKIAAPNPSSTNWNGGVDAFSRINNETNTVVRRPAYGTVNGLATVTATLDGRFLPVTVVGSNALQWRTMLEMTPGAHEFTASAAHSSGMFTTNKTIWVTNNATDRVGSYYSGSGELTNRVWKNGDGTTNRSHVFTWDGKGRLLKVVERDSNNSGRDLSIVYDGLGRRLQTTEIVVTNGVSLTSSPIAVYHYFDPSYEFLELGVNEKGVTTWKVMGPDMDGTYGGQNGTGGFDAVSASFYVLPTVSDVFGNVYGAYDQLQYSYMRWNASRVGGYGGIPGYRPVALGTTGNIADKYSWRNRAAESVGYVWMGANWYDPETSQFLAYDSEGVERGESIGHNAFNGNPVGYHWDGDGRIAASTAGKVLEGALNTFSRMGDEMYAPKEDMQTYERETGALERDRADEALNLALYNQHGSISGAMNAKYNPMYKVEVGIFEAKNGISLSPFASGAQLNYDQRVDSAADATLSSVDATLLAYTVAVPAARIIDAAATRSLDAALDWEFNLPGTDGKTVSLSEVTQAHLRDLTDEAHGLLGAGTRYKSTAIGQYADGTFAIASSDAKVPRVQASWAQANGIQVVNGIGHAEETLVKGGSLNAVEVSSPHGVGPFTPNGAICYDCELLLKQNNVETTSPFSGRTSAKRR